MGWMVFATLLIFYALGVGVFHAIGPVRFLPIVALLFIIVDRFLIWRYRSSEQS